MFLSAIRLFILKCCFRLVAEGRVRLETKTTVRGYEPPRDPVVYVGAALILLALAASESPALMRAERI